MCSPTPSARCATRSRPRSWSARRSTSTSRSTCCSATCRGRRATGCPARASRRGSSPTSPSTGRRGARPRTGSWYVDEVLERQPAIEMEIVFRVQRLRRPTRSRRSCNRRCPTTSPLIGNERLERAGLTVEIGHPDGIDAATAEYADRGDLRGPLRARRGDARRRRQHAARRALRRPRRLDRGDARAASATSSSPSAPPTTPASERSVSGVRADRSEA